MTNQENSLNWFEIPTLDFDRAIAFYESIFGIEMIVENMGPMTMAYFPSNSGSGKVSGALVNPQEYNKPSLTGALIYLNGNPDLSSVLEKIEDAGGEITMPKTKITDEIGFMAMFTDTEGNRIALHSLQ